MCSYIKMCVLVSVLVVIAYVGYADCENLCRLQKDAWRQFCYVPGYKNALRRCNTFEPDDVIVRPGCTASNRYLNQSLAPKRCVDGNWEDVFTCKSVLPTNINDCKLEPHPSVNYTCLGADNTTRVCKFFEPEGTIVKPVCNNPPYTPNFYDNTPLPLMKCIDGKWDNIVTCSTVCGKTIVKESRREGASGARLARRGEVPWHAIVYVDYIGNGYEEICDGTLVTSTVVISAAHAFWSTVSKKVFNFNYAVAVGKLNRLWIDERDDDDAQKSEVKEVHVPEQLRGDFENYHSDIAILIMATPFQFNNYVRPACLHFFDDLERWQSEIGRLAEVAVWQNGETENTAALKVAKFSRINKDQCYANSPDASKQLITFDKICVEHNRNGTKLCVGDTGGGLIFTLPDGDSKQYFVRGVVSDLPIRVDQLCSDSFIVVTQLTKHEEFIRRYL